MYPGICRKLTHGRYRVIFIQYFFSLKSTMLSNRCLWVREHPFNLKGVWNFSDFFSSFCQQNWLNLFFCLWHKTGHDPGYFFYPGSCFFITPALVAVVVCPSFTYMWILCIFWYISFIYISLYSIVYTYGGWFLPSRCFVISGAK